MAESNEYADIDKLKERALKITEALYRTTDMMFDGEPLKWSLRQGALKIMNIVSELNSSGQINEVKKLEKLVRSLFFKLELASSGTYISKMNFEVLKREYSMLNTNIIEQSQSPILLEIPQSLQYRTKLDVSDNISDIVSAKKPVVIETNSLQSNSLQSKSFDKENGTKTPDPDRKTIIVSALKDSGPSSVSEVAKLFNGTIGEKTVQRELNGLVHVGVVKKEGEKRWRRYFL